METDNICIYKEVDKKSTGFNLKTTKLLDCALIGACAVIRWNTVISADRSQAVSPLQFSFVRVSVIAFVRLFFHCLICIPSAL